MPGGWRDATEEVAGRVGGARPELVLVAEASGAFAANAIVLTDRTAEPLENVPGVVLETTRSQAPDARALGDVTRRRVAGEDAVALDYAFTGPNGARLRGRQVAFYRDGTLFQLVFTALEDRFADQVGDFESIVGSLRFSPP